MLRVCAAGRKELIGSGGCEWGVDSSAAVRCIHMHGYQVCARGLSLDLWNWHLSMWKLVMGSH
jgi:hypothetical protein